MVAGISPPLFTESLDVCSASSVSTLNLAPLPKEAAEILLSEGVILSEAKYLLFPRVEKKADPSIAQNRRDLRMTLLRVFPQPVKPTATIQLRPGLQIRQGEARRKG
jgi:hypothetical protein